MKTCRLWLMLLALGIAGAGCGNNIPAINFQYQLDARLPGRPTPPRVASGEPVLPSMVQRKEALEVRRLPNMQRATIGFAFQGVDLPSGLTVDGEAADAPLLLTMSLLRAGASRFLDLRLLKDVSAVASGKATGGLTLKGGLDRLTVLGLYRRVDHVLAVRSLRCGARQAPVKIPSYWVKKDLARYDAQRMTFLSAAKTYVAAVDQAQIGLRKSYDEDLKRYTTQWDQRPFKERFGDFFRSTPDDRPDAAGRLAQRRATLRSLRADATRPLQEAAEIVRLRPLSPEEKSVSFYRCQVKATLLNVKSGDTLWAYAGQHDDQDAARALGQTLDALTAALLARSRLPRPKILSEVSRKKVGK